MPWKRILPILALSASLVGCGFTAKHGGIFGPPTPGSIAALDDVKLGDVTVWTLTRGKNVKNPVLLYIHGGPGGAEMTTFRHYLSALEDDFVVMTYDMPGAGKSYSDRIPVERMTVEQGIADAHQLVMQLRERFGAEKVCLVANSWGTVIGALLVQRYPELFHSYVGVSQWTDGIERERLSYDLILAWAKRHDDGDAVRELEKIGPPPYLGPKAMESVGIQKKLLAKTGGMIYGRDNLGLLIAPLLRSTEYSPFDKFNFMKGLMFSMERMWPESMQINLMERATTFKLPLFLVSGRHDWNIPLSHVERYFERIEAPSKQLVVFENSAHLPQYEEPARFIEFMRNTIKPAASLGKQDAMQL